jgi:SHS2 domain-containing protein
VAHRSVVKTFRGIVTVHYETFEHESDIGIRGFGQTVEEAFENAATALYAVMVNVGSIEQQDMRTLTVTAPDHELLFVEWLNALLSLSDIEHMVFSKFEASISGVSLTGRAWGEHLDHLRHQPQVEIKAATYHMLSVKKDHDMFIAQCVVDV